ncbi:MAG: CBS domain-containing protein [Deltaproteobacteria bacterium]|nr:CBS domain-containing protein [Deltaproteobacteria bacterium]
MTEASMGSVLLEVLDRLSSGKEIFYRYVRTAGDMMDRTFEPVKFEDKVNVVWTRMVEEGLDDLPVVVAEEDKRGTERKVVVGAARRKDIAIALSSFAATASQLASDEKVLKGPVSRVITRGVMTLKAETPLFEAVNRMVRDGLETVAIVGHGDEYLGVLSILDVVKSFMRLDTLRRAREVGSDDAEPTRLVDLIGSASQAQPTDVLVGTFLARVKDVMNKTVHTLRTEDRLVDAVRMVERKKCEYVMVLNERDKVRGVLNEAALQLALPPVEVRDASGTKTGLRYDPENKDVQEALAQTVANAMTKPSSAVQVDDTLLKACERLCRPGVQVLPVFDASGVKLVGAVSRRDLLRVMLAVGELASKRGLLGDET